MLSKLTSLPAIFTISYIVFFVIYSLWQEFSIAKKMFSISAARKYSQKKILPFSLIGILIMSVSMPAYFYLPEKLIPIYMLTLCNFFFCSLFLVKLIDRISSKSSSERIIFAYVDRTEKERNFSVFIASLSSSTVLILLVFSQKNIIFSSVYFISVNLCLGFHCLILSFNKLKIVEDGIIYKFRLIKWNNICAYKNILDSYDRDGSPIFKVTLRVRPSILHMSSFVQIPISSKNIDMDSVTQILAERLQGKNI